MNPSSKQKTKFVQSMTMICEDEIEDKIQIVQRQTDYTEEIAREKLIDKNMDHISVIKEFLGIPEKKASPIKSVQQAIYTELRTKMNDSVKAFNIKQDAKLKQEIAVNNLKNDPNPNK